MKYRNAFFIIIIGVSQLLGLGLSTIGKYVDDMTTWQGQGAQISHYHYVVLDEEVIVLICFD